MAPILVLYYSANGSTAMLAKAIASGIEQAGVEAKIRTVPPLRYFDQEAVAPVPQSGPPYVTLDDFTQCSGLALGSPTRFGNMAAPLKHFIDSTSAAWISGSMINKPACVFSSTSSLHGGQETTLLTMALPLLHHGMVFCGLPYCESALHNTKTGGTPYGVTHVVIDEHNNRLSEDEHELCIAQGKRLALIAKSLANLT